MTMRVLHAGDGYTYLTRNIANGDMQLTTGDSLVDYYVASGNPPGHWAGSGCPDLGMSGHVSEEHMLALFGEGLHPDANEIIAEQIDAGASISDAIKAARLGRKMAQYDKDVPLVAAVTAAYGAFQREHQRRPTVAERHGIKTDVGQAHLQAQNPGRRVTSERDIRKYLQDNLGKARQPVSGWDFVFTPGAKSVTLLWAFGGHRIRTTIEDAHEQAWKVALAYAEREAAFTRTGAGGVAQVQTSGFVATAFLHRDSRAGDPHLHTHVAIANRVLAADGKWRTLDGQQMFKTAVSISEMYNETLKQLLSERLGVSWVAREMGPGKRPVYEIEGIPLEWIRLFSKRRAQIETGYDQLVRDYVARFGHTPPRSVQIALAQQAQLGPDRPAKEGPIPLADQIAQWLAELADNVPQHPVDRVISDAVPATQRTLSSGPLDLAELAAHVIGTVSDFRSTWTVYHVRAEALRALAMHDFASVAQRRLAVENVVRYALDRESVQLDILADATPVLLQRDDGAPIFHRHGSTRYTSEDILACEQRLLDDTAVRRGPTVSTRALNRAIDDFERATRKVLNPGQRGLVEQFVSCGAALALAIGPPGTGKSTAMRAVRTAWETTGGRVIGLAPSAAAASVLGDELNAGDQLLPGRAPAARADTLHSLTERYRKGHEIDVRPGDMLLVDEAGMAGTRTLDAVREIAALHGAVVRLVGDHRQLAAVEAGGALRLLFHAAGGVELTEVRRFASQDEAQAILQFRVGDPAALGFYQRHHRLFGGVQAAALDKLYLDWQHDIGTGATSIMISDSSEIARELSSRAQTDRRARGIVATTGIDLHDGSVAGVGDRIVTRLNRRRWTMHDGRDFVKNGDLWIVQRVHTDGRLTARHVRHGGVVTLPSTYVSSHIELGYAATIHRSQGLTVDVSRTFLTASATRESALVALSRGVHGNYAYLDVEQILDPDEPETLPGELMYRNRDTTEAVAALAAILEREGAELSATEELADALEAPYRFDLAASRYAHALLIWRGPAGTDQAIRWLRSALPHDAADVLVDEAWPALQTVLHEARDAGADPVALLRGRARQRGLKNDLRDPAESIAKVLHYRIVTDMPAARPGVDRPELLPGWIATPPRGNDLSASTASEYTELAGWLRERADEMADRVHDLGERTAEGRPRWAADLGPIPDDPLGREWWIARAGHVAAYRERWCIPDTVEDLLPEHHRGEHGRARTWVADYLQRTAHPSSVPTPTSPSRTAGHRLAARTASVRARLGALTDRLERPGPGRAAPAAPHPAAPIAPPRRDSDPEL